MLKQSIVINMSKWEYSETELWRYGEDNISIYHVFSTVSIKNNVLVFAEARYDDGSDAGCVHDIRMKRSTDGGHNFPEDICLISSDGTRCLVNPCPLYDTFTGRLFLFYSENIHNTHTINYYIFSDDMGYTWSEPVDITALFDAPFSLAGPGHGICLTRTEHAGRLLMQFWHRSAGVEMPVSERGYCVSLLYSDDHGESWQHSDHHAHEFMANESRLIETKHDIIWIMRTKVSHQCIMRSFDGGITWSKPTLIDLPFACQCDTGAVGVCGKEGYDDIVLLGRVSHAEKRRDMEIRISLDGGHTFPDRLALMSGDAMPGYNDLCVIEEDEPMVGIVHCRNNHVMFSRISLQTLTGGKYENTSRSVWLF